MTPIGGSAEGVGTAVPGVGHEQWCRAPVLGEELVGRAGLVGHCVNVSTCGFGLHLY